jgi:hypothetical protein
MAVAFGAIGTKVAGTTTVAPSYPSGITAGHLAIAARCGWVNPGAAAESGWTSRAILAGGTGSVADNHTAEIAVDTRVLVGSESGSVTFDHAGANGSIAQIIRYSIGAGEAWDIAASAGDDASHGAARAVTSSASLDLALNDILLAIVAIDTDAALTFSVGPAVSATGITFGAINRRDGAAGTTNGSDGNVEVFDMAVTAGAAVGPVTFSFTSSPSTCGPMAFLRLRAVTATVSTMPLVNPTMQLLPILGR